MKRHNVILVVLSITIAFLLLHFSLSYSQQLKGMVTSVKEGNVRLNIGTDKEIKPGTILYIYRMGDCIGKVEITQAEKYFSTAKILPDSREIKVGDVVLSTPPEVPKENAPGSPQELKEAQPASPAIVPPEGPVAVMPVIFFPGSMVFSDTFKKEITNANLLAATERGYIAALIQGRGLSVVPFNELDKCIEEMKLDYLSEEGRAPEKLRLLAEKTGAKEILFFNMQASYSYKRMTAFDWLTYQLGAPDVVNTWGGMEVYSNSGEPLNIFQSFAETPAGTTLEALCQSILCIGTVALISQKASRDWKAAEASGDIKAKEFAIQEAQAMQSLSAEEIKKEIFGDRSLYTAVKARELLIKKLLSAWLGTKELGDTEKELLEKFASPLRQSVYSLFTIEGFHGPVFASKGATIGFLLLGRKRSEKILYLEEDFGKYTMGAKWLSKGFDERRGEEANIFNVQLAEALTAQCKEKGYKPAITHQQEGYGSLQGISTASLMKRGCDLGCDVLVLSMFTDEWQKKKPRVLIKAVDTRSGSTQKRIFEGDIVKIAEELLTFLASQEINNAAQGLSIRGKIEFTSIIGDPLTSKDFFQVEIKLPKDRWIELPLVEVGNNGWSLPNFGVLIPFVESYKIKHGILGDEGKLSRLEEIKGTQLIPVADPLHPGLTHIGFKLSDILEIKTNPFPVSEHTRVTSDKLLQGTGTRVKIEENPNTKTYSISTPPGMDGKIGLPVMGGTQGLRGLNPFGIGTTFLK